MIKTSQWHDRLEAFLRSYWWMILMGILIFYAFLILPTINRLGISWDETSDFWVSQAYLSPRGLLLGSPRDPSQTRLPMFLVALVFWVLRISNLLIARSMTVLIGALTLLGIYVYGKENFSVKAGILAAFLLAINPFFLTFARVAYTESDVYLACTLTWLLVFLSRLQKRPVLGYAALSGILLGLSLASKATVIVIIPAILAWFLIDGYLNKTTNINASPALQSVSARSIWMLAGLALCMMLFGIVISKGLNLRGSRVLFHLINYALVAITWLVIFGWAVHFRRYTAKSLALFTFLTAFGMLTFMIFPPDHLTDSKILDSLISRAGNEMAFSPSFILELAALHFFTIFLKSTPLLGLGLLVGFIFSLTQWRRRELTLPLLVVLVYTAGILLLPLGQTFYTIPILPVLSLLAADQLLRLYARRRLIAITISIVGLIWWAVEMKQSYPDYHLNGYQWLGERPFFGRSSIGYRSIVYVPSDGVQQVMEWLNEHAQPGQVAQLYIEPWHIVDYMTDNPVYTITDGLKDGLGAKPDYVVIHIGATIQQGEGNDNPTGSIIHYPFDLGALQKDYVKVFAVQRAFGLEVASIWKRK